MEFTSRKLGDTQVLAGKILESLKPGSHATVVALSGDLGAGKTALTQAMGVKLGIKETLNSPTFVIMKKYSLTGQNFANLIHIDAYRLKDEKDLEVLDLPILLENKENLIVIEWPERMDKILPPHTYYVKCRFIDENTRHFVW